MNDTNRIATTAGSHENTKTWFDKLTTGACPELVEGCFRAFVAMLMMFGGSVPAFAELDLSGMWANRLHEDFLSRAPGPRIGDYMGLPINDEGRARADAWQISIQTMPERQCILYTSQYRKKIKDAYKAPEKCAQDCGGPAAPPPAAPPATPPGAKPFPPTQAPNR